MKLPDKDHPLWKLAQSLVALLGLVLAARHAAIGEHVAVDLSDAAGLGGAALGAKLLLQAWRG